MERLVLRDELSPRRAQGQDGGLQPPRGQDCLFLINLHPNDDKPKLFFSLCASVFCLDCDHRWGLCYHHYLQVSHFVLSYSPLELQREGNGSVLLGACHGCEPACPGGPSWSSRAQ